MVDPDPEAAGILSGTLCEGSGNGESARELDILVSDRSIKDCHLSIPIPDSRYRM